MNTNKYISYYVHHAALG